MTAPPLPSEILNNVAIHATTLSQLFLTNPDTPCRGADMDLPKYMNGYRFRSSCGNYYIKILGIEVCNLQDDLETLLSNNLPSQAIGFEWFPCGADFNCAYFYPDLSTESECDNHGRLYPTCGGEFDCICLPGWSGEDCSDPS